MCLDLVPIHTLRLVLHFFKSNNRWLDQYFTQMFCPGKFTVWIRMHFLGRPQADFFCDFLNTKKSFGMVLQLANVGENSSNTYLEACLALFKSKNRWLDQYFTQLFSPGKFILRRPKLPTNFYHFSDLNSNTFAACETIPEDFLVFTKF